ncbi:MAG: hypothetical protein ABJG88_00930 [Litorimonas sp.]
MSSAKLHQGTSLLSLTRILALCCIISTYFLTACSHSAQLDNPPLNKAGIKNDTGQQGDLSHQSSQLAPSVSVSQIGDKSQTLTTPQIDAPSQTKPQLSVEQLRIFADRCEKDSPTPPPEGLDCSEIDLRMQRLLSADDNIIDALITLGQLGRNDNLARTIDDLNVGTSRQTLIGGAIGGGFVNPPPPPETATPEPSPELEQFLQDNGLILNQFIIPQGP